MKNKNRFPLNTDFFENDSSIEADWCILLQKTNGNLDRVLHKKLIFLINLKSELSNA